MARALQSATPRQATRAEGSTRRKHHLRRFPESWKGIEGEQRGVARGREARPQRWTGPGGGGGARGGRPAGRGLRERAGPGRTGSRGVPDPARSNGRGGAGTGVQRLRRREGGRGGAGAGQRRGGGG